MRTKQRLLFVTAIVLSHAARFAAAHGDEDGMDVGHMEPSSPSLPGEPPSAEKKLISYFANGEHTGSMIAHAALMVLAWVFILPIGVMFSIAKHKLALPVQFLFLILNSIGLLFGIIFDAGTPDLYPNNAHHKIGWAATWIIGAQVLMGLLLAYSRRSSRASGSSHERAAFLPLSATNMTQVHHELQTEANYRWSGDSGQGTEPPSPIENDSMTLHKTEMEDDEVASDDGAYAGRRFLHNTPIDHFLSTRIPSLVSQRVGTLMTIAYTIIERMCLILGFACICTGGVAYAGIMRGPAVFNGLAHFIKGGIFFWFGLLALGRWMGCFADFGWAWNVKPSRAEVGQWKSRVPSSEFTESFLIFLYGATNVFLEHLAAWGGEWVAQDLEHVSISIMFFGGGLCGMLVESQTIRSLLNASVTNMPMKPNPTAEELNLRLQPRVYKAPMNPFPGLIIMLLGLMMSSHTQSSMLSSMVHKQWGTLFVFGALARGVTYFLLYLKPPTSIYASRPPSELITAFCLTSGGLIFMASNKDIVAGIERHHLNAMFLFTVGMGLTAFLMAWEIVVLAIKGWAIKREIPKFAPVDFQQD